MSERDPMRDALTESFASMREEIDELQAERDRRIDPDVHAAEIGWDGATTALQRCEAERDAARSDQRETEAAWAEMRDDRDRLADAARVINGDGAGEFNTRTSALLALRAALARTEQPQGCEYHIIRVKGCRACDALVHTEQP